MKKHLKLADPARNWCAAPTLQCDTYRDQRCGFNVRIELEYEPSLLLFSGVSRMRGTRARATSSPTKGWDVLGSVIFARAHARVTRVVAHNLAPRAFRLKYEQYEETKLGDTFSVGLNITREKVIDGVLSLDYMMVFLLEFF